MPHHPLDYPTLPWGRIFKENCRPKFEHGREWDSQFIEKLSLLHSLLNSIIQYLQGFQTLPLFRFGCRKTSYSADPVKAIIVCRVREDYANQAQRANKPPRNPSFLFLPFTLPFLSDKFPNGSSTDLCAPLFSALTQFLIAAWERLGRGLWCFALVLWNVTQGVGITQPVMKV